MEGHSLAILVYLAALLAFALLLDQRRRELLLLGTWCLMLLGVLFEAGRLVATWLP